MHSADHEGRPARLPSWLLSLALHLIILVLLGVLVRGPRQAGLAEPDRSVGIVLAQHHFGSTDYLEESPGKDQDSSAVSLQPAAATSATLPDSIADALNQSDLALPQTPALPVLTDGVFATPNLSGGGRPRLRPHDGVAEILNEEAERRKQNRPPGASTRVSVFGSAAAEGRSFVFVIDRSRSMGSEGLGALAVASREFQRALAALKPVHQFQILAYNHERVFFGDEPFEPATEENKDRIEKFMRGLAAFGGTDHYLGISSALYREPDVIFLLTDGGDPPLGPAELVKIRRRAAGRTTIHCIQFGARPTHDDHPFMQALAEQNGGSFRYVDLSQLRQ